MSKKGKARSAARLAAVQALYQMDISGTQVHEVITEFTSSRLMETGEDLNSPDHLFFTDLLRGIVREQKSIDPPIQKALRSDWPLTRIDSTLRAILRAGTYELMYREDVPFKAVISEYMDIAHAFFDDKEAGMVNGVLDALAKATGRAADSKKA